MNDQHEKEPRDGDTPRGPENNAHPSTASLNEDTSPPAGKQEIPCEDDGDDDEAGKTDIIPPEPKQWPERVDGDDLMRATVALMRKYIVADESSLVATSLWVIGTYLFQEFVIFPRLAVTSPEKRCGKTTFLDVVAGLVNRPLLAANITAPALFRTIEALRPTLIIDEADRFLKGNQELIGILNAGHRRGQNIVRLVEEKKGKYKPQAFNVYAPVVVAGIGDMPSTLADRSVPIQLRRKLKAEMVATLRLDRMGEFVEVKRKIIRWCGDNILAARRGEPDLPGELYNRAADNWRPLLTIAKALGPFSTEKARQVSITLTAAETDESAPAMLMADLSEIFQETKADELFTEEILNDLNRMEHRPWAGWHRGEHLRAYGLAKLLKPFKVYPGTVRRDKRTAKGYKRASFDEAFARYL